MPHVETVEELKHYLYLAMQLEHATIPPYLLALYSIHPGSNPEAAEVVRTVVVEEMLHLTLAANILNAVGGEPDLTRNGFVPLYPAQLPDGETDFYVDLQPFSTAAINTFLKIERPKGLPQKGLEGLSEDGRTIARPRNAQSALIYNPKGDENISYWSIGEFYRAISEGLDELHRQHGDALFCGPPERQVGPENFYSGGGECLTITDLSSAQAAIELIIEQGEGYDYGPFGKGDQGELAHEYRFDQLQRGRKYVRGNKYFRSDRADHPTGAELKVDWSAVYPFKVNARLADYEDSPELHKAAVDFNNFYKEFLAFVTRAFNGEPHLLLVEGQAKMMEIRNKIVEIIRNPIWGTEGVNATPTFELYE